MLNEPSRNIVEQNLGQVVLLSEIKINKGKQVKRFDKSCNLPDTEKKRHEIWRHGASSGSRVKAREKFHGGPDSLPI